MIRISPPDVWMNINTSYCLIFPFTLVWAHRLLSYGLSVDSLRLKPVTTHPLTLHLGEISFASNRNSFFVYSIQVVSAN